MAAEALILDAVRAGYGGPEVLRGVSARVEPGRIVAVIGPNGSGKSTLLRVCMGLLPTTGGAVRLGDVDVAGMDPRARARRMALVPQSVRWSFPFAVRDVVLMGRHPHQAGMGFATEEDLAIAEAAMADTGIAALADRPADELSGGEMGRTALAAALAQAPDVLLLDEPTANLDLGHEAALRHVVRRIRDERGLSALVAMHDLSLAAALADELWLLHEGEIRRAGSPAEVLDAGLLEEVYGVACEVRQGPGSVRVLPLWEGP